MGVPVDGQQLAHAGNGVLGRREENENDLDNIMLSDADGHGRADLIASRVRSDSDGVVYWDEGNIFP